MSADFTIKRGANLPKLRVTMKDSTGAAVNLSGSTVTFRMRPVGSPTLTIDHPALVVNEAGGIVEYVWHVENTQTPGEYLAEFVVSASGDTQIVPSGRFLKITIAEAVA